MKKGFIALCLSLSCLLSYGADGLTQLASLDSACRQAEKEGKQIFMVFSGSDWCTNYKLLKKEVLSQQSFLDYAKEHFVFLMVDFPNEEGILSEEQVKENEQLFDKYNKQGTFPCGVFLSPQAKVIGTISGYRTGQANNYIEKIEELGHRTNKAIATGSEIQPNT